MTLPKPEPTPPVEPVSQEASTVERIGRELVEAGFSPPAGERWFGDDAAVVGPVPSGQQVVLCTDAAVESVHADLDLLGPAALGWRAVVATLSDLGAMGSIPWRLVVSVAASPAASVDSLMEGAIAAAARFGCPVVGGDVTSLATAVVSVAGVGLVDEGRAVGRDGACVGDALFLTGRLGASAAGLRAWRRGEGDSALGLAHLRPEPRLSEGRIAGACGARAMIDISDGLSIDARRMAVASGVGLSLSRVPVAPGASLEDALGGGEDYELLIATGDRDALRDAFARNGLRQPLEIGVCTPADKGYVLDGGALPHIGWQHDV